MKHSFNLKKSAVKSIYREKLQFKDVRIEDKSEVYECINTILAYIDLEEVLQPTKYSYNFFLNTISFQLELNPSVKKDIFFTSIRKFEDYMKAS